MDIYTTNDSHTSLKMYALKINKCNINKLNGLIKKSNQIKGTYLCVYVVMYYTHIILCYYKQKKIIMNLN